MRSDTEFKKKKKTKNAVNIIVTVLLFAAFVGLAFALTKIDVQAIGPEGSSVGFASINGKFAEMFPYNEIMDKVSEYLGYFSIVILLPFVLIGAGQLFLERRLSGVDYRIIFCGLALILMVMFYFGLKDVAVCYRPVVLEGEGLEPSYPSSHVLLGVACFLLMAVMSGLTGEYLGRRKLAAAIRVIMPILAVVMVVTRMVAGVHWFTDIVGGTLLGAFCAMVCRTGIGLCDRKRDHKRRTPDDNSPEWVNVFGLRGRRRTW